MLRKHFDPRESFFGLTVVKATFSIIVALSVIFSLIIIYNSDIDLDLSYKGFNRFVEIFKVPLGTLALLIPSVALLAANHRSEQTREQILTAQSQNNFSNYYKHIEEFDKYCKAHSDEGVIVQNPIKLHGIIFDGAKNGIYTHSKDFEELIDNFSYQFINLCEAFEYSDDEFKNENIVKIDELKKELFSLFSISTKVKGVGTNFVYKGERVFIPEGSIGLFLDEAVRALKKLVVFSGFGGKEISGDNIKIVLNMDLNSLYELKMEKGKLKKFSVKTH